MNTLYGFPIFDSIQELVAAYNYLNYNVKNDNRLKLKDAMDFKSDIDDASNALALLLVANVKIVNNTCADHLFRALQDYLNACNYKFGFLCITPELISKCRNPFIDTLINKVADFFAQEYYALPVTWIYFERIQNTPLEQFIKLKYSEYCTDDGDRLFVQLTPHENFKFILEFIDDIFRYS